MGVTARPGCAWAPLAPLLPLRSPAAPTAGAAAVTWGRQPSCAPRRCTSRHGWAAGVALPRRRRLPPLWWSPQAVAGENNTPPPGGGGGAPGSPQVPPRSLTYQVSNLRCGACAGAAGRAVTIAAPPGTVIEAAVSAVTGVAVVTLAAGADASAVSVPSAAAVAGAPAATVTANANAHAYAHADTAAVTDAICDQVDTVTDDGGATADAGASDNQSPSVASVVALVVLAAIAFVAGTVGRGGVSVASGAACCGGAATALTGGAVTSPPIPVAPQGWSTPIAGVAATIAAVGPARRVLIAGTAALLRRRSPNMDSAVALSAAAGVAASAVGAVTGGYAPFFHEPLATLAVVSAGRMVETRLRSRATAAADELAAVAPGGGYAPAPANAIMPGDRLLVPAGTRVPVDGVATPLDVDAPRGSSGVASAISPAAGSTAAAAVAAAAPMPLAWVDTSTVTGEAAPRPVFVGTPLCSGYLPVATGPPLGMAATARATDSTVARVRRAVALAGASRAAGVQRLADTAAARLVWVVLGLAAATAAAWSCVPPLAAVGAARLGPAAHWRLAAAVAAAACPCAMGLAVPLALAVAAGSAASQGILYADGAALEGAAGIGAIALDKTGTLTNAAPAAVTAWARPVETTPSLMTATTGRPGTPTPIPSPLPLDLPPGDASAVLQLAAAVERHVAHPLGAAIVAAAVAADADATLTADAWVVSSPRVTVGAGVTATVRRRHPVIGNGDGVFATGDADAADAAGVTVAVGSLPWLANTYGAVAPEGMTSAAAGVAAGDPAAAPAAAASSDAPASIPGAVVGVYVAGAGLVGTLTVGATLLPAAVEGVARLRALPGVTTLAVLSGDSAAATSAAAAAVGIVDGIDGGVVRGGLSPDGKVAAVRALQAGRVPLPTGAASSPASTFPPPPPSNGHGRVRVAMVGDGVNDAPALAAADCGVAVRAGAAGAAAAAATTTVASGDLSLVAVALSTATAAVATARRGLAWAAIYNAVALPLAAGVGLPWGIILPPSAAAAAMAVSSVGVVLVALRLGARLRRERLVRLGKAG
ncbi:hypothetical protein MMPV_009850 [Pyropia vietnamensis]